VHTLEAVLLLWLPINGDTCSKSTINPQTQTLRSTDSALNNPPFLPTDKGTSANYLLLFACLFLARQPPLGHSLIHEVSRPHSDTPQSVRLFWTSDQFVAETSTWQNTTLTTDVHASGWIRTHNLSRRAAADLRLRPSGHRDPLIISCATLKSGLYIYNIQSVPGGMCQTSGGCSLC